MKKILKWVFSALLGVVPAMGADQAGIIDDPFFTDGTCSIRMVVESGSTIKALVDATSSAGASKSKLVEALCATIGWEHHDPEHFSYEKVGAQVICGVQLLEKEYTKKLKKSHELKGESETRTLNGVEVKDTYEPLAGETVTVSKATLYERPDGSSYKEVGENLYQLMLEETSVPGANFRHCQREWEIFSQWKRKTRHQVQVYGRTDVTRTLYKVQGSEKIILSSTVTPLLKPVSYEPDVPTCGNGPLPANYKIVS